MIDSFAGNPGVASAALRGTTLRVQKKGGAPDLMDDPFATTVLLDAPMDDSIMAAAEDDLDGGVYAGETTPQADMMDENTTNDTAYLENNYPLAAQPEDQAAAGLDPTMMDPSMLAGMEGPGGVRKPRAGMSGAIMKGLGFGGR